MSDSKWQHSILQGIGTRIEVFAELYPRPYLWCMTAFALLGYACLLLFPLLALAGVAGIVRTLAASPGVAWLPLSGWLLATVFGGLVSYRLFRFRHCLPAGVVLARAQAPALFQLVEAIGEHYASPGIDRILVTDGYQLDVVKTPVLALPVWSTRTLLVGLPLLQCLSGPRFQCALARRLGQFSGQDNALLNWLYALRSIWPAYHETMHGTIPACLPVRALFTVYAPLYMALSTAAARLDELQADSYAMELFSDEDMLDTVTTDAVHRQFLRESYWPTIRRLRKQDAAVVTNTHVRMATVMRAGLQGNNLARWVEQAKMAEQQWDDPWPSLVRRLENIGHAQAAMTGDVTGTAAEAFLAIPGAKLDAALGDLPPPQIPQLPSLQERIRLLGQAVETAAHDLLHRLRHLAHPGQPTGEAKR